MLAFTAAMVSLVGGSTSDANALSRLPLANSFVRNQGQWDSDVRFRARAQGLDLWVSDSGYTLDLRQSSGNSEDKTIKGHVVKVSFVGSRGATVSEGTKPLDGTVNFMSGTAGQWVSNVARFAETKLINVVPNVDARYYFDAGIPRYDLIVRPGAKPSSIRMKFDGAENLRVDAQGRLNYDTTLGTVQERNLTVFQESANGTQPVQAKYVVNADKTVSFELGNYDSSRPVIIDPLVWVQYPNGSGADLINKVAVDSSGNVIGVGSTLSSNYPTTAGAYRTTSSLLGDVVVTKYSADGTTLLWSTFLGGDGADLGKNISATADGTIVVVGSTTSRNFPSAGTQLAQEASATNVLANTDGFVSRLNAAGSSLTYSSRIGGSAADSANGVVFVTGGVVFATGNTASSNFPYKSDPSAGERGLQTRLKGGTDAWLAKIDLGAGSLFWSTFMGGSSFDTANEVALQGVDPVVVGTTESTDFFGGFTSAPGYDKTLTGARDAFVVGINNSGNKVRFRTYFGGSSTEDGNAVAVNTANNNIGLGGTTASSDFPRLYPVQKVFRSVSAFATVFDPTATNLVSSTYLGNFAVRTNFPTFGNDIAFDGAGVVILGGTTDSPSMPTAGKGATTVLGGTTDGFIARIGRGLLYYSSFVGGPDVDGIGGIAVDANGITAFGGLSGAADWSGFIGKFSTPVKLVSIVAGGIVSPYKVPLTVTVDGPVAANTVIDLTSGDPLLAVPANVTIPKGLTAAKTFAPVGALWVDLSTTAGASYNGDSASTPVNVMAPILTALNYDASVLGGVSVPGTATTSAALPLVTPVLLSLVDATSGDPISPAVATVTNTTVYSAQTTGFFQVQTSPVQAPVTVKVKGPLGFLGGGLLINPPAPMLTLNRTTIVGGISSSVAGTVTLDGKAPAGGYVVAISSDNAAANVPASVTVPAGSKTATFSFLTKAVATDQTANISASANSFSSSAPLQITAPTLKTFTFSRATVKRGRANTGTVYISSKAPVGGLTINLMVTNPATGVTAPATLTIPAGASYGQFTVTTLATIDPTTAMVTATLNGNSLNAQFDITL
jgi:hypothetical protein